MWLFTKVMSTLVFSFTESASVERMLGKLTPNMEKVVIVGSSIAKADMQLEEI